MADPIRSRTMRATARCSSNTVTVSLTVNDRAPVANADSYTTNEDTPLVVPANGVLTNDTDPDAGDTLTAVLNTSVTHGTLTLSSNGSFTYTPAANYNGPDSFAYHANDGTLDSPAVTVTITIAPVNDPPAFTSTPPTTAKDDATYVYAVTATDVDGDTLVIAAPTLPAWLTLTPGTNGNASLSGKPAQANVGVNHVTLSVSDPTGPPVLQNFDITVTHVNVPPKIQDPIPDQTATEAVPFSLSLAPFVTDPDKPASSLTYAVTSGLPASLLLSAAGAISGTPLGVDVGPHQVKFTVSDGIAPPVPGSFNLNVLRASRADLAITLTAAPNPVALGGARHVDLRDQEQYSRRRRSGRHAHGDVRGRGAVPVRRAVGSGLHVQRRRQRQRISRARSGRLRGHDPQLGADGPRRLRGRRVRERQGRGRGARADRRDAGERHDHDGAQRRAARERRPRADDLGYRRARDRRRRLQRRRLRRSRGRDRAQGTGVLLNIVDPANASRRILVEHAG